MDKGKYDISLIGITKDGDGMVADRRGYPLQY